MKNLQRVGIVMMTLTLAGFIGCSKPPKEAPSPSETPTAKGSEEEHDHGSGPHHGTVFDFGKWHAEFTVNHNKKEVTVYILGANEKTAAPIGVEKLLLSIKTPSFQTDLKAAPEAGDPKGKSSRFVGKHDNFGKEQEFEGTLSAVIDGKPYAGDFKEVEEKDPKHDKK